MLFLICFFRYIVFLIIADYICVMNNQQDFKKKIMIIVGDYTSGSVLIDLGEEQLTMDIDKNRCKPGAAMAAILVGRSLFLLPLVG